MKQTRTPKDRSQDIEAALEAFVVGAFATAGILAVAVITSTT